MLLKLKLSGISREPNSIVTTIDTNSESSVTLTCEGKWFRFNDDDEVCDFVDRLDVESAESLAMLLGLSMEWRIHGLGPFNSTEALTPALSQRGIVISTTCTFNAEQLFHILQLGDCRQHITPDLVPHCTSTMNISRQAANSNVRLQCSIEPSQCANGRYKSNSNEAYLRLQGMPLTLISKP